MDISKKVLLFLTVFLLLAVPNFAIPYFENEYITTKYGSTLSGQYYYKDLTSAVDWYWATPSFENNGGYYDIFDYAETVSFDITINTSLTGDLYLWLAHINQSGDYEFSYYLVKASSSYNNLRVSKNVMLPNTWHGATYYYWTLYSGGNFYYSNLYSFFIKDSLLEDWQYKRTLTVTTTDNMEDGIFEFEINDTDFYDNSKTFYVPDDCDYCLAGTTTDIVITNTELTKAYPYFIKEFKGGYFEHNQNTSNLTLIDVWVNEGVATKNFNMYYGFDRIPDDATASIFGSNRGHILDWQSDDPNNPFAVHQIFSDYRWIETMFNTTIGSTTKSYSRASHIGTSYSDGEAYYNPLIISNTSKINWRGEIFYGGGSIELMGDWAIIVWHETYNELCNETNCLNIGSSTGNNKYTVKIENNNISLYKNDGLEGTLTTNKLKFGNITKITSRTRLSGIKDSRLYEVYELTDVTDTYTLGNQTLNDYALVNFESMYEYSTFINDLWVGGIISTDTQGTILCYSLDGNALGSIKTPETPIAQSYEITFPYLITNETDFLSRADFNYTCKFVSDLGYEIFSENYTITFENNRTYISDITPTTQYTFSSEFIPVSIDLELNYTGINTNIDLIINAITCNAEYQDKCLEYDFNYLVDSYSESNINTPYSYADVFELNDDNWYEYYFRINKSGNISSTPPRLFYISEVSPLEPPPETYLDWNDTNLTEDEDYMDFMFWNNPLYYLSSFVYQSFVVPNIEGNSQTIFLYVFTVFWNFLFILLLIAIATYIKVQNLPLTLGVVLAGALLFGYIGWISISATTILLLVIAGTGLYLKKSAG